jgi:hypothetical protein
VVTKIGVQVVEMLQGARVIAEIIKLMDHIISKVPITGLFDTEFTIPVWFWPEGEGFAATHEPTDYIKILVKSFSSHKPSQATKGAIRP